MNLAIPETIIILLLVPVPLILVVIGSVDAATKVDWAWERAGQRKGLWLALMIGGLLVPVVGAVMAVVYLVNIRPKVAAELESPGATPPPSASSEAASPGAVPPATMPPPGGPQDATPT